LGDLKGAPVLASETCALDIIGAKYVRDVENGEIIVITEIKLKALSHSQMLMSVHVFLKEYIFQDLIV
jgi:glutamine phosphoribosylpyrophosphate amidotransferase